MKNPAVRNLTHQGCLCYKWVQSVLCSVRGMYYDAEHHVAYYNRLQLPCETRYILVGKECLAIVAAVQKFRISVE